MQPVSLNLARFGVISSRIQSAAQGNVDYTFSRATSTSEKEWGAIRHLPMKNNEVVIRQKPDGDALIYDILQPTHFRPVRGDELSPVLEMIGNSTLIQTNKLALQQGVNLAFHLHKILQTVEKHIRSQFEAGTSFSDIQTNVLQAFSPSK